MNNIKKATYSKYWQEWSAYITLMKVQICKIIMRNNSALSPRVEHRQIWWHMYYIARYMYPTQMSVMYSQIHIQECS